MNCKVENGMLELDIDGKIYSFEAHGEEPRPSMLGLGLSVGGKHWSDRNPDITLERHTSIQSIKASKDYVAWYTQEFIPNGVDYKVSKKANIYVGSLHTGEHKLVYKGECYGDLCFDGDSLYFNMGNKVAVVDVISGEYEILFKHSGIKKNGLRLQITDERIFYNHWTKNSFNIMWYDRNTKEIVNPHIDSARYYLLDKNTLIFHSFYYSWVYNIETKKKKHFFSSKAISAIKPMVFDFFKLPSEIYDENFKLEVSDYKDGRLTFVCSSSFKSMHYETIEEEFKYIRNSQLPLFIKVEITCNTDGSDVKIVEKDINITYCELYNVEGLQRWSTLTEKQ